jgi:hypothetical protein
VLTLGTGFGFFVRQKVVRSMDVAELLSRAAGDGLDECLRESGLDGWMVLTPVRCARTDGGLKGGGV